MNEKRLFVVLSILIIISLILLWYISGNANEILTSVVFLS